MNFNRWNTFWTVCYGVMAFIIIVGNTVSISVLLKRRLRKRPRFLLISLAMADLLVGLFAIPIYIILFTVKTSWLMQTSWLMLLIYDCVDMLTGLSSVFTLAVISLERLHAIVRPLRHRQLNIRYYIVAIATPWILSLMVTSTRVLQAFFIITAKQILIVIVFSLSLPLLISCFCLLHHLEKASLSHTE